MNASERERERTSHASSRASWVPASERVGRAGPPPPRSGFGEVSPEPPSTSARAQADGAKPSGKK
jgi:hypothetical protein